MNERPRPKWSKVPKHEEIAASSRRVDEARFVAQDEELFKARHQARERGGR